MTQETLIKLYETGDYYCFARSTVSDFEWYLAEETGPDNQIGIEYSLIGKEDIDTLQELGYVKKSKETMDFYESLGMTVIDLELILKE